MKSKITAVAGVLAVLGMAAAASAQPAPAAPAAAATRQGPAIHGMCTYNNDRAIGTSAVGRAVDARLKQLTQAVEAELTPERNWIQGEERTLQQQASSATPTIPREQLEQRALALRQRAGAFERKAQLRVRELQATQQKALSRIATELRPILGQVYAERNCSIMLDQGVLYNANPSMDVTDMVIQRLNAKIQTFAFERERLDTAPAASAAAPAAGRPAAPAPAGKKK